MYTVQCTVRLASMPCTLYNHALYRIHDTLCVHCTVYLHTRRKVDRTFCCVSASTHDAVMTTFLWWLTLYSCVQLIQLLIQLSFLLPFWFRFSSRTLSSVRRFRQADILSGYLPFANQYLSLALNFLGWDYDRSQL